MIKDNLPLALEQMGLGATGEQIEQFILFAHILLEWNTRMNLTRITLPEEVAQKHFADSLLPLCFDLIPQGARCIDVGTGAGFPGIPLMIMRPDIKMTLLDSLKKRLTFLETLCEELGFKPEFVHARAEDAGQIPAHREKYDIALSRAVAPAPVLMEYSLPLVKVKGSSICYKGKGANEEFAQAKRALTLLGAGAPETFEKTLPWGERSMVKVPKATRTPPQYPRQAGTAAKTPL